MPEKEITLTDPARELAELCQDLQLVTNKTGEAHLSAKFDVRAWSPEFFQIVFTIVERCTLLQRIVADLELDEDFRSEVVGHVGAVMDAFSAQSMKTQWQSYGNDRVGPVNLGPIKAVSGLVRQSVAYRKLSEDEISEVRTQVSNLLQWLTEHQLSEQDFIRQALIDGLKDFEFRLTRLRWLGWGYTLNSLRDVIAAYMLLERGLDRKSNPDAAAVLQKVGTVIKKVYAKVGSAKDATERGDWLLRAYGAGSLLYHTGKPLVRGFIGAS